MTISDFLAKHPIFSLSTAVQRLDGHARKKIAYAMSVGRVTQLRRGVYGAVPPGSDQTTFSPNRYLVMAETRPDSVLCGHSALELMGLAHSEWLECSAYSNSRRSSFSVAGVKYRLSTHPSAMVDNELLGVQTERIGALQLRRLGVERCLCDGFDRPRLFGGIVELVRSLEGASLYDFNLLLKLLALYDRRTLYGAVGWFLDRTRLDTFVPDDLLTELAANKPLSPHYLDRRSGNAVLVPHWNVLIPRELLEEGKNDF